MLGDNQWELDKPSEGGPHLYVYFLLFICYFVAIIH